MTGRPTNRKNWSTVGGDPVPDTDCGSLFYFLHYCGIEHFGIFISISHTVTGHFSRNSAKWLTLTMNPPHFGKKLGVIQQTSDLDQSRNQWFTSQITFGWGRKHYKMHSEYFIYRYCRVTLICVSHWEHILGVVSSMFSDSTNQIRYINVNHTCKWLKDRTNNFEISQSPNYDIDNCYSTHKPVF